MLAQNSHLEIAPDEELASHDWASVFDLRMCLVLLDAMRKISMEVSFPLDAGKVVGGLSQKGSWILD